MIFGEGPIIKNIAGDLNKLFLQGTRAGQPINNVEGDAAADLGTIQLMADRDPVIRDISTGLGWAGREVTVSGTGALQLVNSLGRPLKSWQVELSPYQEGSGDPSPENVRRIYGTNKLHIVTAGKNLFTNDFIGELYLPLPQGTHITASCTSAGNNNTIYYLDANKQQIDYWALNTDVPNEDRKYRSFVLIQDAYYWRFANNNRDCQIEIGDTPTPFTPYITPTQIAITLPQTIYSGSVSDDGAVSNKAYVLLNDSDKWVATTGTVDYRYEQLFSDRMRYDSSYAGLICTYLPVVYNTGNHARWTGATADWFGLRISGTTLDQIKADAAAGKIAICYDLATPITLTLSTPSIPTPTGNITTWAMAEDGIVTSFSATYLQAE